MKPCDDSSVENCSVEGRTEASMWLVGGAAELGELWNVCMVGFERLAIDG